MNAGEGKSINKASKCKTATRKGPKQGLKSVDFARFFDVLSHSKTVGRGFKSYCPCQKSKSKGLDFFVPIKSRKYITPLIAPAASELYRSTASAPTIIGSNFITALFGWIRRGNSIKSTLKRIYLVWPTTRTLYSLQTKISTLNYALFFILCTIKCFL